MASRTRVISQNKAVYVTPTGWDETAYEDAAARSMITGAQLQRVDTLSFEMDLAGARTDVRQFGQLARIGTVNLTEVNPTLSFGYYLGNGANELALGFFKSTGAVGGASSAQMISGQLAEDDILSERNVFVLTVQEGKDAAVLTDDTMIANEVYHDVVGFGNCFISSYSANFSVGDIPRADVEMQASNVVFWTGMNSGLYNPSLNLEGVRTHSGIVKLPAPDTGVSDDIPLVLRPQDVTVSFGGTTASAIGGAKYADLPVQSASIDVPLSRQVIEALGNELAYAKLLEFPIDVTLNISSLARDFRSGALEYALTGTADEDQTNITLDIKNNAGTTALKYVLQGAVLDSQSFSQGLDDNETVDLSFSAQIGGADTSDQGLFFFPTGAAPEFTVVSGQRHLHQPINHI